MNIARVLSALTVVTLLTADPPARAGFLSRVDPGAGPNALRPNSDLARDEYLRATAGTETRLITFEGLSGGSRFGPFGTTVPVGQGVTLEGSGLDTVPPPGFQYGLTNVPNASAVQSNARLGYNISGDARFTVVPLLNAGTASVVFRSAASFNSVGLYLTGLGNQSGDLELLLDGVNPFKVTGSADGGVLFVGYVGDPESRFRTLELRISGISGPNRDVFSIDDVRFNVVPEPGALVSLGIGLGAVWLAATRARRNRRD